MNGSCYDCGEAFDPSTGHSSKLCDPCYEAEHLLERFACMLRVIDVLAVVAEVRATERDCCTGVLTVLANETATRAVGCVSNDARERCDAQAAGLRLGAQMLRAGVETA